MDSIHGTGSNIEKEGLHACPSCSSQIAQAINQSLLAPGNSLIILAGSNIFARACFERSTSQNVLQSKI